MDERYVVAPGVTIEVSATGDEYIEGDFITPADFPTIAEFKGFLAAGRIIRYVPPSEQPSPRREWDYFSIDEELDEDSPNPVSNRALYKAMENTGNGLSEETAERKSADEKLSARIDEAEERARQAEESNGSSIASERTARKEADEALSARLLGTDAALSDEAARASRSESNLGDSIDSEKNARESKDSELDEKITAERQRALLSEGHLSEDIAALSESLRNGSQASADAVSAEEARARNAEEQNARAIGDEKAERSRETAAIRNDVYTLIGNDEERSVREIAREVISGVYRPRGSAPFASIPPLSEAQKGDVWNVEDSFVTTDDFVEGAGKKIPAGSNIVAVVVGETEPETENRETETENGESETESGETETENGESEKDYSESVLKWDVLGGSIDLSEYQTKATSKKIAGASTVEGALVALLEKIEELRRAIWEPVKEKISSVLGLSEKSACLATVEGSIVEEWTENDFAGSAGTQFGGGSATTRGTTHGLYVDASAAGAKWYERTNTPWSLQVNAGVKVYVPATAMQKNRRLSVGLYEGTEIETDTEIQTVNGGTYISFTVVKSGYIRQITYMHDSDSQIKADASGVHVLRDLSVGGSITSRGKNAVLSVNGTAADESGNVTISVSGVPSDYDTLKSQVSELEKKVATLMQNVGDYQFVIEG